MKKEIRIYYESYEQAEHFIKPIIEKEFPNIDIVLVYLSKGNGYIDGSFISKILDFKNPDIIISYVQNNEEIPLFVIEFSEAVTTEDHELQRFDGYLGAISGKCFYVKISPIKTSSSEHGGNTNFDIIEPYALTYKRFKIPSFHFEWPIETYNFLERDSRYLACPPKIENFNFLVIETIKEALLNFSKIKKNGLDDSFIKNSKKDFLNNWIDKLIKYEIKDIHSSYNSTRIKWLEKEGALLFKFNRMGHGMDPERGMIWYHRYRDNKPIISRIIFPSADDIFEKTELKNSYDYLKAFMVGTGLDKNSKFSKFIEDNGYVNKFSLKKTEIDITNFIKDNFYSINKHLLSIFCNSQKILIQNEKEQNEIILFWSGSFSLFKSKNNHKATKIKERKNITEDDVTYVVAHQILSKNGFEIISLSYPGAQGDRAILPQAGSGRKQKRKYVDIISCYQNKYLNLTENKDIFSISKINEDIEKLNQYKSDKTFKIALEDLIGKISPKNKNLPILLSVSFSTKNGKNNIAKLHINKIDFFITLDADKKTWKVWTGGNLDIFKYKEGKIDMEKTYCIDDGNNKAMWILL
jgi:hypothetical protein